MEKRRELKWENGHGISSGTGMSRGRTVFAAAFRGIGTGVISRRLQYGVLAAQYSTTVVEVGCATVGRFKTIDASALPSWEQQTMDPGPRGR